MSKMEPYSHYVFYIFCAFFYTCNSNLFINHNFLCKTLETFFSLILMWLQTPLVDILAKKESVTVLISLFSEGIVNVQMLQCIHYFSMHRGLLSYTFFKVLEKNVSWVYQEVDKWHTLYVYSVCYRRVTNIWGVFDPRHEIQFMLYTRI